MSLGLRLSTNATATSYDMLVSRSFKYEDGVTRQVLIPGTGGAIMGGAGLGAALRFSHVSLSLDGAVAWSQYATLSQFRLMASVPILFNDAWEFRPSLGYRRTLLSVDPELGPHEEKRSGLVAEFELALPLNDTFNLTLSANGTVSNGLSLAEVQPGIIVGVETFFGKNIPYKKPARGTELALSQMNEAIVELMRQFPEGHLDGVSPHLFRLIAASKKLPSDWHTDRLRGQLDKIDSLANYIANHAPDEATRKQVQPSQDLSGDLAKTIATEIAEDKLGMMARIMKEGEHLFYSPYGFQMYSFLIALQTTLIEDLLEKRPEVKRIVNGTHTQLKCLQGKASDCEASVMRISWPEIKKAHREKLEGELKSADPYFEGGTR